MGQPYRDARLVCPQCASDLEAAKVGDASIDVCPTCQGIWVDWFDGELPTIARRALLGASNDAHGGDQRCPLCRESLANETYLGADVLRCGGCSGVFASRAAVSILSDATAPRDDAAPSLEGFLDRIQRFRGRGSASEPSVTPPNTRRTARCDRRTLSCGSDRTPPKSRASRCRSRGRGRACRRGDRSRVGTCLP